MNVTACGIEGTVLARMQDCQLKNPAYARYHGKKGLWHLITSDPMAKIEYWFDEHISLVWTNPLPWGKSRCQAMKVIHNGDLPLEFRPAVASEYQSFLSNPPPKVIQSEGARLFIPADADQVGSVYDEQSRSFRNSVQGERHWLRCVAD